MTAAAEEALRLFVAIELPPAWQEALRQAQASLRAALDERSGPRLRWVRPEGIHLTLKFLGGVSASRLDSVSNALARAAAVPPAFSLTIGRIGTFGDRRGPRVVWVSIDGESAADRERLYRLAENIEDWLASAGFPREQRFRPHLTLARLPEGLSRDQRALAGEISGAMTLPPVPPMAVGHISLMRSHLGPGGARYECITRFPQP